MLSHQESGVPEDFRVYGQTSTETPWRSIYLAAGLLIAGVVLLFTGIGLWATDPDAHGLVLFVLGLVIFVPGAYFSRIAYYAYKGREGYSFDAIPNV
eukprot:jgi/Astpho2/1197/Aster-x0050